MTQVDTNEYAKLINQIGYLLSESRGKAAYAINTVLVQTYWSIGQHIVEFEQSGSQRAVYGEELINRLSRDLTSKYGKGFNRSGLQYMRKFYTCFPICRTVSCKLSWSHYVEILKTDDPLEISFYTTQCEKENWSVRELKRQRNSMLFQRLALSKDKAGIIQLYEPLPGSRTKVPGEKFA